MRVKNPVGLALAFFFFFSLLHAPHPHPPEGKNKNKSTSSDPFPTKFHKLFLIDVNLALSLLKFFVKFYHYF